jgi:hypothetical protein
MQPTRRRRQKGERSAMKACRDQKTLKANLRILLAMSGFFAILAILALFLAEKAGAGLPLAMAAAALLPLSVVPVSIRRLRQDPAFAIMDSCVVIGKENILLDDIQHVQVFARIIRRKDYPDSMKPIDRLALLPPLPNLAGSVTLTTLQRRYSYTNIMNVMEILAAFCRKNVQTEAVYVRDNQYRPYLYLLYDPKLDKYDDSFSTV